MYPPFSPVRIRLRIKRFRPVRSTLFKISGFFLFVFSYVSSLEHILVHIGNSKIRVEVFVFLSFPLLGNLVNYSTTSPEHSR